MDNIKFRFAINNKVYDVYAIDFATETVEYNNDNVMFPGDLKEGKLLQWTGLKDKNGKDIYEGDIVKIHNWTGKMEIIWKDGEAGFNICYYLEDCAFEPKDIKIIGNKFENPELLKKE